MKFVYHQLNSKAFHFGSNLPQNHSPEIKSPLEGGKTTHTIAMVYYRASSMQWLSCQRVLHKLISLAVAYNNKMPIDPLEAVL